MVGVVKKKYILENGRIYTRISRELDSIEKILPEVYDGNVLFDLYSMYFPSTIEMLNSRFEYYKSKDNFLRSVGKKSRFNLSNAKDFFFKSHKVKNILSIGYREKYQLEYNEENRIFF